MTASLKIKRHNYVIPLFDDRDHTITQEDWESMLPGVSYGRLLRKRKNNSPHLEDIETDFGEVYDENKHGETLRAELTIYRLTTSQQAVLTKVVNKYWNVFSKQGVTTTIIDYECEIDNGNARPIICRNPTFGPLENPLIEKPPQSLLNLVMPSIFIMVNGFTIHFWPPSLIRRILMKLRTLFVDFVLIISLLTPLPK